MNREDIRVEVELENLDFLVRFCQYVHCKCSHCWWALSISATSSNTLSLETWRNTRSVCSCRLAAARLPWAGIPSVTYWRRPIAEYDFNSSGPGLIVSAL